MDNILNQRWYEVDKEIIKLQNELNISSEDLQKDIQDLFNSLNINYNDLNKPIPNQLKVILNSNLREVKKLTSFKDYFKYKLEELSKGSINYKKYIEITLYIAYLKNLEHNTTLITNTLKESALITYNQGRKDRNLSIVNYVPLVLTNELLKLYVNGVTLEEYLQTNVLYNIQELNKRTLIEIQNEIDLDVTTMSDIFEKQRKRIINIRQDGETELKNETIDLPLGRFMQIDNLTTDKPNDTYPRIKITYGKGEKEELKPKQKEDKIKKSSLKVPKFVISGGLDKYIVSYCNKSYIGQETNEIVVFVAKIDYKTTGMCRSMDKLIFNTNKVNKFARWSEIDQRRMKYVVNGLVLGVNLPPINNHEHPCRSTIHLLPRDLYTEDEIERIQKMTFKVVTRKDNKVTPHINKKRTRR